MLKPLQPRVECRTQRAGFIVTLPSHYLVPRLHSCQSSTYTLSSIWMCTRASIVLMTVPVSQPAPRLMLTVSPTLNGLSLLLTRCAPAPLSD